MVNFSENEIEGLQKIAEDKAKAINKRTKPLPHFACYPSDFFIDARFNRLPGEVRGTWCQLLLHMWHAGIDTHIIDNDEEISFQLNLHIETWREHRKALEASKLLKVDYSLNMISSRRLYREFNVAEGKCQQKTLNILKRWEKERLKKEKAEKVSASEDS